MKKIILPLLLCVASFAHATVYTVNNNIPSPGQYTSVNTAIAAASAGDTIYITGSPYNYNSFTISKKLTIIGTGWEPRSTNGTVSLVDNINFSGSPEGSAIIGLDLNQITIDQPFSGLLISRNKFRYRLIWNANINNVTIEGNWFDYGGNTNCIETSSTSYTVYNLYIRNNVIDGRCYISSNYGLSNIYLNNNIFIGNGSENAFYNVGSANASNNVFFGRDASSGISNSTIQNNITFGNSDNSIVSSSNTLINNQINSDPLFESALIGSYTTAQNYRLLTGSPAINAGTDGSNIGLSGGDGYFETNGVPGIPQMNSLQLISPANGQVNPGGTIQVQLSSTIQR